MAFDLPRAARQLRFTGPVRAAGTAVPATKPLARPRPTPPGPAVPWQPDEDDVPTTVARSPLSSDPAYPPPMTSPAPRAKNAKSSRSAKSPRPIPNFRPAPPAAGRPARGGTQTRPSKRKRAMRSLPLFAWILLSVVAGAISFHLVPPLADKIAVVALHKR